MKLKNAPIIDYVKTMITITDELLDRIEPMTFSAPVIHVYNPLRYARDGYDNYLSRFGNGHKKVILVGMNPGPFGMVQTGVPFGDVEMVRDWLGIEAHIDPPADCHPKRPVLGFACPRKEVSGQRLWGWARQRYVTPEMFFASFGVINYCPLVFVEESGRNRTPDKLPAAEKKALFEACDLTLRRTIDLYRPEWAIGIGAFAESRIKKALGESVVRIGRITHPSPANPKANRGWAEAVEAELADMGIDIGQTK